MSMPTHRVDPTQGAAEERAGRVISVALVIAAVCALAGVTASGTLAVVFSGIAVGIVTAIPILRVAWLVKRWLGQRDVRFAWVALVLLALIAIGPLVGLLQR